MNKERYIRAFNRFLIDNPDIDMNEAEKEFNELIDEGVYKLDDEYDRAEELYEEASKATDLDDTINLLREAQATCNYHYDSKILLALLELTDPKERIDRLEEIREEYKRWLKTRNIDLDNITGSIWLNIEARPYVRLLSTITDECIAYKKYNDARKYSEMQYRLDYNNVVDSLFDYVLCVTLTGKHEYALKLSQDYSDTGRYSLLNYYNYISLNKNKEAFECYKTMFKTNPYYASFLSGIFDIDQDEITEILNQDDFLPDSFEEAIYYITKVLPLIELMSNNMDSYLDTYYNKQINLLISLPEDEIVMLTRIASSDNGLTAKDIENLFEIDNEAIEHATLLRKLNKLVKRKYLDRINNRFYMSRLTYFILKTAMKTK